MRTAAAMSSTPIIPPTATHPLFELGSEDFELTAEGASDYLSAFEVESFNLRSVYGSLDLEGVYC